MKRLILAALVLAASLAPAAALERIQRFISDVQVQRNGDLLVSETIEVWAEGAQIRRGILRDFPTVYHRTNGSRVEVGFHVESVTRDNAAEEFATEKMANGVRVRIGSSGRSLNTGTHIYVISYRTTRQIGFFDGFDELYWNATGTGWTFPIDWAEARITLPDKVEFKQSAFYTGPQGARGQDARIVEQTPGRIVFRTTKPMPVANGLTVAVGFPKSVVAEPTGMQKFNAMLEDEPALKAALPAGGFVLAFYLLAWFFFGRDPRGGTVIPLFGPPAGMSAAAVRFVQDMTFDDRVFAAAIVGLGVNGHLRLIDKEGKQELQRGKTNGKSGTTLDEGERAVETALFDKRSSVSLDNSDHEVVSNARAKLHGVLKRNYLGTMYRNNFWLSGTGFLLTLGAVSVILAVYAESYPAAGGWIFAGVFIPLIPIMVGVGMMRIAAQRGGRHATRRFIIGVIVILVALAIGAAIMNTNVGLGAAIAPAFVCYALAALASFGFSWLQCATRDGRKVMDQIEGFRQYLNVAEEDRLEYLNPPKKTPELFEKFLPYAIALDVENSWAQKFAGVLAAAGVGAAVSSWYVGDRMNTHDIGSFTDRLGSSLPSTIASAASPPGSSGGSSGSSSSSGSSGGGSSGGGGGGGGGSGW